MRLGVDGYACGIARASPQHGVAAHVEMHAVAGPQAFIADRRVGHAHVGNRTRRKLALQNSIKLFNLRIPRLEHAGRTDPDEFHPAAVCRVDDTIDPSLDIAYRS